MGERPMYTAGSDADFDRLYRDCYHRILYTLLGVLGDLAAAEDCTQEAFLRAYRAWDTWRPDAPAEAWLHRIALNVAFSHRRWQKLRRLSELVTRLGQPRSPEIDAPDLDADLWRALRRLPPRQAAIVV